MNLSSSNISCLDIYWTHNYSKADKIECLENYLQPTAGEIVLLLLHIIVFIVGLVGNFLVCYVVYRCKNLQTATNIFIVNLAVADFVVILICLPPTVVLTFRESWYLGEFMCKFTAFLQTVSVSSSVGTLCAISVERYFGICHPLTPKISRRNIILVLTVIWILSCVMAAPNWMMTVELYFTDTSEYFKSCTSTMDPFWIIVYDHVLLIGVYIVPFIIIAACYIVISRHLWHLAVPSAVTDSVAMRQLKGRRKIAKMLMVIVVLFAVCYLPSNVFQTLKILDLLKKYENERMVKVFYLVAVWLCYFNSAINPVIYNFNGNFRREFKRAFNKKSNINGDHRTMKSLLKTDTMNCSTLV